MSRPINVFTDAAAAAAAEVCPELIKYNPQFRAPYFF
jgi:c-di-AMP phosphodiesterase-like protein